MRQTAARTGSKTTETGFGVAEYIRFRLTAAKVGVSMALLALIAGIAEKGQASPVQVHAAQDAQLLKLTGISGPPKAAFLKLETKVLKLDRALLKLERNLSASFLKVKTANATFLKIGDANAQFLKIDDANAQFLKIDGTAANAQKVGGISADGLIQGKGQVLSNQLTPTSTQQVLLGDGSVKVLIGLDQAGTPTITLENDTSSTLSFTVNGATPRATSIAPGGQTSFTPGAQNDIQIFSAGGGGGAGKIWTAVVSQNGNQTVGQMLIGLL